VIRPAQEEMLKIDSEHLLVSKKKDVDTATIIGLRLQIVF
jgi:hypothetical protein